MPETPTPKYPKEYFVDEHGRCPRCGRKMAPLLSIRGSNGYEALSSNSEAGLWGYLPDSSREAFRTWTEAPGMRRVRCGDGEHHIMEEYWRPELDGPFAGYDTVVPEDEGPEPTPRTGPIYSDYDEVAGF